MRTAPNFSSLCSFSTSCAWWQQAHHNQQLQMVIRWWCIPSNPNSALKHLSSHHVCEILCFLTQTVNLTWPVWTNILVTSLQFSLQEGIFHNHKHVTNCLSLCCFTPFGWFYCDDHIYIIENIFLNNHSSVGKGKCFSFT